MYLGTRTDTIPAYHDRFVRGIGMLPTPAGRQTRTLHCYQCEGCGAESHVLERAEEPFYCRCQTLIGVQDTALHALSQTIIAAGTRTEKQLQKERLQAEWRSKKQAKKPQAEPVGLCAQTQEELWPTR